LVRYDALTGKVAVLAATGGTPLHGLMLEHQLRPLCGYFGVVAAPTTIYALESDFAEYRLDSPAIETRIARAVAEAQRLVAPFASRQLELAGA
jgi:FMN reductase